MMFNRQTSLWMGDLDPYMDENFIKQAFSAMGESPLGVKIITHRITGGSAGYCFVELADEESVDRCVQRLNGKLVPASNPQYQCHTTRLSLLGVAVFCLLGVGVIYDLYSGVISNRLAAFRQRRNVDLRELLALSVEAAILGGKEVKRVREENGLMEKSKGKTREGANDPLTMGDVESHRKMFNIMRNTFPEITVNSEEHDSLVDKALIWSRVIPAEIAEKIKGRHEVPAESVTVWIDPLDATQEYTESLLKYVTTMVCVAVDGKPVIGVIHQPFTDFTAWALVGEGGNVNIRSSYSITPPKVIISRSYSGQVKSFVHTAFGINATTIEAGGAGYKVLSLLNLPSGKSVDQADVYVHITFIKKWDICAGAALLSALGGHLTTLKGEEIDYRDDPLNKGGLVASVGLDHKALLEKLPNWDPEKH